MEYLRAESRWLGSFHSFKNQAKQKHGEIPEKTLQDADSAGFAAYFASYEFYDDDNDALINAENVALKVIEDSLRDARRARLWINTFKAAGLLILVELFVFVIYYSI